MVDVVFGDGEKALIKMAKKYELEEGGSGSIGGSSKEVVSIGYYLDIGDISGEIDGSKRKNLLKQIWGCVKFSEEEIEEYFKIQGEDIEKLLNAARDGMQIRI